MALTFNPFTGDFDFIAAPQTEVEVAEKVAEEFDLYGIGQLGDLIIPSPNQVDSVEAISSNYYTGVVFGIIIGFISPTRVKVLISGKLTGATYQLSGLTFGSVLFISSLGKLTTTPPPTGHLQRLGIAVKSDSVFLNPSPDKVVRA